MPVFCYNRYCISIQEVNSVYMCDWQCGSASFCMCSSLSWSDVLKWDIFQVTLSTEVPVLSECQYDNSSQEHSVTFIPIALCCAKVIHMLIKKHTDIYTPKSRTMCHSLFDQSYHIAWLSRFSCVRCHFCSWMWTWQLGVNHPNIGSKDKLWRGSEKGHGRGSCRPYVAWGIASLQLYSCQLIYRI